jgi:hypothetical protein
VRIGIYGDSFADPTENDSQIFAWFNLLPEYLPNCTTESYGLGGTSVYFSYNEFLRTYKNFDYVIFLVTTPNRYTKKVCNVDGRNTYFHSLQQVESYLKNNPNSNSRNILENLISWFIMSDDQYIEDMNELMIKDILSKKEEILLFPCFEQSFSEDRQQQYGLHNDQCMIKIMHQQLKLLGMSFGEYNNIYEENPNTVTCHFTKDFNHAIAEFFATKIQNGNWNWDIFKKIKLEHPLTYYYNKKNEAL